MRIELLNKGDKVLAVNDGRIAIRRKNGDVDLIPYTLSGDDFCVDMEHIVTIGFICGVKTEFIDGVEITDF